ncbi:UNVERIFIED_CONTAM: hypothetical protein FKN15_016561 [Acipenser sinensis]
MVSRVKALQDISFYDFIARHVVVTEKPKTENISCYTFPFGYIRKRSTPYLINHYRYSIQNYPENYFSSYFSSHGKKEQTFFLKGAIPMWKPSMLVRIAFKKLWPIMTNYNKYLQLMRS